MSFLSLPSTSQGELVNITRQKWEVRRWGHHLVCHHVGRHTIKQRRRSRLSQARRTLHYMKYLHTGSTHIVIMSYSHNVIMTSCRQVVMSSILYIVWQSVSFLPLGETIDCDVTPSHSLGSEENLLHSTSTAAAFSAETLWRSWGLSIVPCNNQSWARDYVTIFNCNSERVLFNCLYITLMF